MRFWSPHALAMPRSDTTLVRSMASSYSSPKAWRTTGLCRRLWTRYGFGWLPLRSALSQRTPRPGPSASAACPLFSRAGLPPFLPTALSSMATRPTFIATKPKRMPAILTLYRRGADVDSWFCDGGSDYGCEQETETPGPGAKTRSENLTYAPSLTRTHARPPAHSLSLAPASTHSLSRHPPIPSPSAPPTRPLSPSLAHPTSPSVSSRHGASAAGC